MKQLAAILIVVALIGVALSQSLCFLVGGQLYSQTTGTTKGVKLIQKFYFNPLNAKGSPARYNGYATGIITVNVVAGKTTNTQFDSCKLVGRMIDYNGNKIAENDSIVLFTYSTLTEGDTLSYNLHNDDAFTTANGIELTFTHYNAATGDSGTVYLGVQAN